MNVEVQSLTTTVTVVNNPTSIIPGGKKVNIVTVGIQGPPGVDGITPGQISKIADANLGGHRVVISTPTGIDYADSSDLSHLGKVLGITNGAIIIGASGIIIISGEIIEPSWSWALGNVFVGVNGVLTQTAPTVGFIQIIGVATSPTSLLVAPKLSIQI